MTQATNKRRVIEFDAGVLGEVTVVFNDRDGNNADGETIATLRVGSPAVQFRAVESGYSSEVTLEAVASGSSAHGALVEGLRILADQVEQLYRDAHQQE